MDIEELSQRRPFLLINYIIANICKEEWWVSNKFSDQIEPCVQTLLSTLHYLIMIVTVFWVVTQKAVWIFSSGLLASWLSLQSGRWRRNVPPKHRLILNGYAISQEIKHFMVLYSVHSHTRTYFKPFVSGLLKLDFLRRTECES